VYFTLATSEDHLIVPSVSESDKGVGVLGERPVPFSLSGQRLETLRFFLLYLRGEGEKASGLGGEAGAFLLPMTDHSHASVTLNEGAAV